MASVAPRKNKDGSIHRNRDGSISFKITIYLGEKPDGKSDFIYKSWCSAPNTRESAALKKAKETAILLEEQVRSGQISSEGKTTFEAYSKYWMKNNSIETKTIEQYEYLLKRINKEIGHLQLEKIRVYHLKNFYAKLREDGARESGKLATSNSIRVLRKEANLTQQQLSIQSNTSVFTIAKAEQDKPISLLCANKLCSALGVSLEPTFTVEADTKPLSDTTIWHHHKLISAILATAKMERLVPQNIASENMKGPVRPDVEAKYMNRQETEAFIVALVEEPDVRIRTALTLDLFTGMRRGELCGLSWHDIDFENKKIHINRSTQYIHKVGVVTGTTKTKKSTRTLAISDYIVAILTEYSDWWQNHKELWGKEWQGKEERLFIQDDGKPIFPRTIYGWLQSFLDRNNLASINMHSLRHTAITLLMGENVDLKTIQSISGHSKPTTLLNTYAHFLEDSQEKAAKAMDNAILKYIPSDK